MLLPTWRASELCTQTSRYCSLGQNKRKSSYNHGTKGIFSFVYRLYVLFNQELIFLNYCSYIWNFITKYSHVGIIFNNVNNML